jgi:hypothetical protein
LFSLFAAWFPDGATLFRPYWVEGEGEGEGEDEGEGTQGNNPADARIEALRNSFDGSSLARRVTSFEENNNLQAGLFDPLLKLYQLDLKLSQFALVVFALEFSARLDIIMGTCPTVCAFAVGPHWLPKFPGVKKLAKLLTVSTLRRKARGSGTPGSCARDEGGPLATELQDLVAKHLALRW